jgi:type IV pilus assembly protein PilE
MTLTNPSTRIATHQPAASILGFTLIEVLITVLLISILAAIAMPNYQAQVQKARRTSAQVLLLETAQKLERCASQFGRYNDIACTVVSPTAEHYTITILAHTASTYVVSAAPTAGSPQTQDLGCLTFTLNQNGVRASTSDPDFSGSVQCWNE